MGEQYNTKDIPISLYTLKSIGVDPAFASSAFGLVTLEHIKVDNKDIIRVIDCVNEERADPNKMVQLCWDLYKQYGFINTVFWLDGANAAFTNLAKIKFNESLYWQKVKDFGKNSNVKIRPVSFGSESRTMLSNIHAFVAKGIFAVPEKYDKLLISMRTAYAEDLVLKKDVTSYDDLFDATRLALKGYNFK